MKPYKDRVITGLFLSLTIGFWSVVGRWSGGSHSWESVMSLNDLIAFWHGIPAILVACLFVGSVMTLVAFVLDVRDTRAILREMDDFNTQSRAEERQARERLRVALHEMRGKVLTFPIHPPVRTYWIDEKPGWDKRAH